MMATRVLRAANRHIPLIRFLGKRSIPESIDHTPRPHPQNPHSSLPKSFIEHWAKTSAHSQSTGEFFDRSELPRRFWRLRLSKSEMQAIEEGAGFI